MAKVSGIVAVIFDLGDTLVHLRPPEHEQEYDAVYLRVLRMLQTRYPTEAASLSGELLRNVGGRVGEQIAQSYAPAAPNRLHERDALTLFREAMSEFAPEMNFSDALIRFLIAVEEQAIYRPQLADGVGETLQALRQRGIRTGLCSNYFGLPEAARANLNRMGLLQHFDQTVFSCEVGWRKPDPAIYQAICRKLAARPGECLFIGDRLLEDVRGPQQLGMRAALASNFRQEQADANIAYPDLIITQLNEVLEALET